MRITIDLTEAESRSTTVKRESEDVALTQPPTSDGGAVPESLLLEIGQRDATHTPTKPTDGDTDAGGLPSWLVDAVESGGERHS